jgi:hypothetical protein
VIYLPIIWRILDTFSPDSDVKEFDSGHGLLNLLVAQNDFGVLSIGPESAGFSLRKDSNEHHAVCYLREIVGRFARLKIFAC